MPDEKPDYTKHGASAVGGAIGGAIAALALHGASPVPAPVPPEQTIVRVPWVPPSDGGTP